MEMKKERTIKRGEIYFYDFGESEGSIQSGQRPVLVLQCNEGNSASTTTVIAAITTAVKKCYLPSHVVLGRKFGLKKPSMVMLEQLRTVNQSELKEYVGRVDEPLIMKRIGRGLKKALGIWIQPPERTSEVRCLCGKCLKDYKLNADYMIRRLDPLAKEKQACDKCPGLGFDYIVVEKKALRLGKGDNGNE